ncbi:FAD-binding oxidoreductase [Devosia oryziradicis]|uniref:FAD-binding oxidoreductase n=1 Tax=Devosia oryziradicis TaxID=2801335 RepID=A0ABX7BZ44_9HYPH|nr:FAD-binding oxidoreductase [Devosia oryziradicis]QQR37193.1 FAD-binding oxidoreductase [Devosia oryziradicis]
MILRLHTRPEIGRLVEDLPGKVTLPGDPVFEQNRRVLFDPDGCVPAALVRGASPADISRVIGFARQHGFDLAIRGGGHSSAGHGTVDGGIVIDLRDLDDVAVDEPTSTVWVGGGATVRAVLKALEPHGLVVGFGDSGDVGVGGIVSGGGIGYLSRLHGATIDSVLAAEVVLADGRFVMAGPDSEPDLFWAIRGGGGNFGVITRIQFQARPLPAFTGGMLVLPGTAETIAAFVAAAQTAPEALSAIAMVMPAPPAPFIPEAYKDKLVLFAMMAFAGPDDAAAAALAPFRALGPVFDAVKPGPLLSLYDGPGGEPPGMPETRTFFVDRISKDAARTIVGFLTESDSAMRMVQIRVLGGAVNRVPSGDTAYAHRDAQIMMFLANFYSDPADRSKRSKWVDDLMSALRQEHEGAYVNFLGDEGPARTRSAYPGPTWDRLRRIKRQYDPENVFRRNQNIPPASA